MEVKLDNRIEITKEIHDFYSVLMEMSGKPFGILTAEFTYELNLAKNEKKLKEAGVHIRFLEDVIKEFEGDNKKVLALYDLELQFAMQALMQKLIEDGVVPPIEMTNPKIKDLINPTIVPSEILYIDPANGTILNDSSSKIN